MDQSCCGIPVWTFMGWSTSVVGKELFAEQLFALLKPWLVICTVLLTCHPALLCDQGQKVRLRALTNNPWWNLFIPLVPDLSYMGALPQKMCFKKKTNHPRTVSHWKVSFPPAPKFKSYLLRQFKVRHRISHGHVWGISSSPCLADSLPEQMPLENNISSHTQFARPHLSAPRGEPFIPQPHNDSRAAVEVAVFTCMSNPVKMHFSATRTLICSLPASTAIQEVSRKLNPLSKEPAFGILL